MPCTRLRNAQPPSRCTSITRIGVARGVRARPDVGADDGRAGGRTGGQKPKLGPRQVRLAREMYDSGDYTVQQIADEFGVTRPTIYRHLTATATGSK
ncbi:helix-turn-helix domain-containing protein [Streptosporangium vulgare]|uniref:Helix-turn-helix domain-containing protein n=1 Tax=Streptosporangium vulgare TaxID=46190 RepID=A0ABV5TRK5_9ACTN